VNGENNMQANERPTTVIAVTITIRRKVIAYVKKHGYITNRQCRDLLGLGYDQVISLFNRMVEAEELERQGKTSGIKYVLRSK